ncbi:methylated-DNA--[protein]-cysteine S-methyltransferase [Solihabitans fulvus]|uniref:methylated-DNA--[protein]-cysteine S-methyltransferase n=1 Tax=Solihabitans fulvus TaxID=1892852 RepID=A0A5B2X4V2_9PSEU|nr:methylated-DNA--[protein]-cysteine S-methyltransferase [Solihabitans fulvus]KAA2258151.1 methylated-DNA--[protein]-cysteine S-methyltransferase [Solihabitans fulvus]
MVIIDRDGGGSPPVDELEAALAALAVDPPASLSARIFAQWCRVTSPTGDLYVAFSDQGISYVRTAEAVGDDETVFLESFRARFERPLLAADRPPPGLLPAVRTGRTRPLRFDLGQLTDFERAVLTVTAQIPAGQTRPYGWVAKEIGRPKAVRAVGTALGRNPVPVLIPCHRVTRSDGVPGEYVFGPQAKERLLRAEAVNLDEVRELASERIFYLGSDTTGIVCFPTCHHARRITAKHRKGFRNIEQAAEHGYRPCLHCRPGIATGDAVGA